MVNGISMAQFGERDGLSAFDVAAWHEGIRGLGGMMRVRAGGDQAGQARREGARSGL